MRHLSQAPKALISLAIAVGLLVGASAAADTVYKWKDANGQSHYSQQPPDGVSKYETINAAGASVQDNGDGSPAKVAAASGKADADSAAGQGMTPAQTQRAQLCKQAHDNVSTLTSHATVTTDVNGDGKPVTLNAAQHDQALVDANKQVGLYCSQ